MVASLDFVGISSGHRWSELSLKTPKNFNTFRCGHRWSELSLKTPKNFRNENINFLKQKQYNILLGNKCSLKIFNYKLPDTLTSTLFTENEKQEDTEFNQTRTAYKN